MLQTLYNSKNIFSIEVTHNKKPDLSAADQENPKFQPIELPLNIVQLNLYFVKYVFLHNGTQLEGEKCKFKKLQNKDHPSTYAIGIQD